MATLKDFLRNLEWLFIVSILVLSTLFLGGYIPPFNFLIQILILTALAIQIPLIFLERNYLSFFRPYLILPLGVFLAFLLLVSLQGIVGISILDGSYLGSIYPYETFNSLKIFLFYLLFFLLCLRIASRREQIIKLSRVIVFLVFTVVVLALAQDLIGSPVVWNSRHMVGRPYFGPFVNQNFFGGFIGLTFPIMLACLHYSFREVRDVKGASFGKGSIVHYFDKGTFFFFFLTCAAFAACILSDARSASIVMALSTVIYLALSGVFLRRLSAWILVVLGLAGAAGLIFWLGWNEVMDSFGLEILLETLGKRLNIWMQSLELVRLYPLFGVGFGTYQYISPWVVSEGANYGFFHHAENDYIQLAGETGWVGFGFFLAAILFVIIVAPLAFRRESSWKKLIVLQALVAIFSIALMDAIEFNLVVAANSLFLCLQLALLFQNSLSVTIYERAENKKLDLLRQVCLTLLLGTVIVVLFREVWKDHKVFELREKQQYGSAYLKRAAEISPNNAGIWGDLTYQLNQERNKTQNLAERWELRDQTLVAVDKFVKLNPTNARAWYVKGFYENEYGLNVRAVASLEKAVYWAPHSFKYRLELLEFYLQLSRNPSVQMSHTELDKKVSEAMNVLDETIKQNGLFFKRSITRVLGLNYFSLLTTEMVIQENEKFILLVGERLKNIYEVVSKREYFPGPWQRSQIMGDIQNHRFEGFLGIDKKEVKKIIPEVIKSELYV